MRLCFDIENSEIGKAGGKGQVVARKLKGPANTRLWFGIIG